MEPDARNAAVVEAFEMAKSMLRERAFKCGMCNFGKHPKKGYSIKTSHFGERLAHPASMMPYSYKLANTVASRKNSYDANVRRSQNEDMGDEMDARFLARLQEAGFAIDHLPTPETWQLPDLLSAGVVQRFTANIFEYFNRQQPTKTARVQLTHIPGARDGMVTLGELCSGAARVLELLASDDDLKGELNFTVLCDNVATFSHACANQMRRKDKLISIEMGVDVSQELAVAYVW
jgi:hypothetical protein